MRISIWIATLMVLPALAACTGQQGFKVLTSQSTSTEKLAIVPLEGTATDDGLPKALTTKWEVISGPGPVDIADPSSLKTSATFKIPGQYKIRLSAFDGAKSNQSEVTVTVQ
jgi:hypothetical protein